MEHRPNLCLLRSGLPDLAEPLAVDGLAAAHPIWSGAAALFKDAQEDGRGRLIAEGDPDGPWVILCGTCVSSLDVAWELIRTENLPPAWGAVLAVSQSGGRGRLRRPWTSPPGNFYAALRFPLLPREWRDVLSLSCGWFAAEALAWLGADVRIKWPNDLLLGERKVGGILVEERGEQCVAGIGINIAGELPSFSPREAWSPGPAWLSEAVIVDPFELLAALVKFGQHWYDDRVGQGPPGRFLPAFKKWMAWMDEVVRVHGDPLGKPEYTAKIIGLLPDGALLVERDGGTEALRSGSIAPARDGAG